MSASGLEASPTRRRGGRPRKYDWSDKRDICHRLYVEEKKNVRQVVEWFAEHFSLDTTQLPSTRDFHRQFRRWGFKTRREERQRSPQEEEALITRLRELFMQNISSGEIADAIRAEGWDLQNRDIYKIRSKNGLLLRISHGFMPNEKGKKRRRPTLRESLQLPPSSDANTEETARRAQRYAEVQLESDQRLAARKRRRRIRGYAHLPADQPGLPPRYNSETSLDECKVILSLDNDLYNGIRNRFTNICTEYGIIKKTQCGPEVWQAAKDRLILEESHLSAVSNPLHADIEHKFVALDVICADVTKRMRVETRKVTIADANVGLGLNPMDSKQLRKAFYDLLIADHFQSRLLAGEEHYQELREQWYSESPLIQAVVAEGEPQKMRMVNALIRDAVKRYQDDKKRNTLQPATEKVVYGPGPGPAPALAKTAAAKKATAEPKRRKTGQVADEVANPSLDPLLRPDGPPPQAVAAYFRLSPASHIVGNHPKMWLGKLRAATIAALHEAATVNVGAAKVAKVQGVVKNDDGTEDMYQIDEEMELQAYIAAAEAMGKVTFLVMLEGGYA
ncbi:hypothetical protein K431DRAFT_236167 [Polychaeton citri CBS 116435]|uniref:Clr5 domain-containing protein n=1 Tax=Polychaeton citri CBS 116435 TaxID=1314669 RepID=A0A9P4PYD2_9PEZI|nr:hypothetical protein K431DRAFT_236167 [Polychaeton citri CBS 116435]